MHFAGDSHKKDIIIGTIPGSRSRGRPKVCWYKTWKTGWRSISRKLPNWPERSIWTKHVHRAAYLSQTDGTWPDM